jgi:hypothetical protein
MLSAGKLIVPVGLLAGMVLFGLPAQASASVVPVPYDLQGAVSGADLCAQVGALAGFLPNTTDDGQLTTAVAVALAESSCNPGAVHDNGVVCYNNSSLESLDRGLWQVNNCAHPNVPDSCAYDAQCNANAAFSISASGTDWNPWSTYQSGAYLNYLTAAEAAVVWYLQSQLPSISNLSPSDAGVGAEVSINGTNLSGATSVSFNGTGSMIVSDSASQIVTVVPSGATTGNLSITTPQGTASAAFTVDAGPGYYSSFNRYENRNPANGHYETAGAQPSGYYMEGSLGQFGPSTGGPGTTAWYSCRSGTDEFTSVSSSCEGSTVIGFEGNAFSSPPAGIPSVEVYRCRTAPPATHFDSLDPTCEGQISEGPLGYMLAVHSFNRYTNDNPSVGHYETTGTQPADYYFESSLGEMLLVQEPGTIPWYSCRSGTDVFTSVSSSCEGSTVIGQEGFAYLNPPAGIPTVEVYRCHTAPPATHFDSLDPTCEGKISDGPLGYLLAVHPFNRYENYNPSVGHYVTTMAQPSGYYFEHTLGYMLMVQVPGTIPWYSCRSGTDVFTSVSSSCEGSTVIGQEGYAYLNKPAGIPTVEVYRCHTAPPATHFDSLDPACEGQISDGPLGYLLADGWPITPTVPGAPTIGTATAGNASATVNFTAPASDGGSAITSYTVTATDTTTSANGGETGSSSASPITVDGLTNGDTYTFTVTATNSIGTGAASAASNSVIPTRSSSTTALSLSSPSATYGHEQLETFNVTVAPDVPATPTGTVTVKSGSTTLCAITLSSGTGQCSSTSTALAAGSDQIIASYGGNGTFNSSTSSAHTFTVSKASSLSTTSLSAATVKFGHEHTERFTVSVSPQFAGVATGKVVVKSGSKTLCTITLKAGKGSCSPSASALSKGSHSIAAYYAGDGNIYASVSKKVFLSVV